MEIFEIIQQKWLRKEMELNQRHKKIIKEREDLLSRHKIRFLSHESKVKRLAKDLELARDRNKKLVEEIELFERGIKARQKPYGVDSELEVLKAKYWKMVMRELVTL